MPLQPEMAHEPLFRRATAGVFRQHFPQRRALAPVARVLLQVVVLEQREELGEVLF